LLPPKLRAVELGQVKDRTAGVSIEGAIENGEWRIENGELRMGN
jgi:hypothetical protein